MPLETFSSILNTKYISKASFDVERRRKFGVEVIRNHDFLLQC